MSWKQKIRQNMREFENTEEDGRGRYRWIIIINGKINYVFGWRKSCVTRKTVLIEKLNTDFCIILYFI